MIFKYPFMFILLVPICLMYSLVKRSRTDHTVKFPKASWMTQLKSKRALNAVKLTRFIEIITLLLVVISLAQPQLITAKKLQQKKGIDIVVVLDTSGSMSAEDFKPKNRITVAKNTLNKFLKQRRNDRIGLIVFGKDAITKAPITYDHDIILNQLSQTDIGDAGDGTAIGLALATGVNRLEQSSATSKIIILLTDGVNNAGQIDPVSAAQFAKNKNIKVYTIGIGTIKGAPIPIYHPTYGKIYARYPNGQLVLTELDEEVLKEISTITNGRYFNATDTDELKKIYKEINELEKSTIDSAKQIIVLDIFPYLLAIIIGLLLIREGLMVSYLVGVRT
ncbi:MAG: vWA domain-containing protein [Candidatus Marinamargulisbacteria bacterium]